MNTIGSCGICDLSYQREAGTAIGREVAAHVDLQKPGETIAAIGLGVLGVVGFAWLVGTVCSDRQPYPAG